MKKISLIFAILFLTCCQNNAPKPTDLLSDKDMHRVLIAVHTLEARLLEQNYNLIDSAQVAFQNAEKQLFKDLKIPYTRYKNSYDFYLKAQPERLEEIYKVVIDSLEKREKKASAFAPFAPRPDTTQKNTQDTTLLKKRERKRGRLLHKVPQ